MCRNHKELKLLFSIWDSITLKGNVSKPPSVNLITFLPNLVLKYHIKLYFKYKEKTK